MYTCWQDNTMVPSFIIARGLAWYPIPNRFLVRRRQPRKMKLHEEGPISRGMWLHPVIMQRYTGCSSWEWIHLPSLLWLTALVKHSLVQASFIIGIIRTFLHKFFTSFQADLAEVRLSIPISSSIRAKYWILLLLLALENSLTKLFKDATIPVYNKTTANL